MQNDEEKNDRAQQQTSGPDFERAPCCGEAFDKSSFRAGDMKNMKKMMQACPCGAALERHRLAIYSAVVGLGLAILVLPIGWVLGVIAFFRTI